MINWFIFLPIFFIVRKVRYTCDNFYNCNHNLRCSFFSARSKLW